MDHYSVERWMLDRQAGLSRAAEAHTRRRGWRPQARLAELMAGRLRSLADRLDAPRTSEGRLRVLGDRFGDAGGPDAADTTGGGATRIRTA